MKDFYRTQREAGLDAPDPRLDIDRLVMDLFLVGIGVGFIIGGVAIDLLYQAGVLR